MDRVLEELHGDVDINKMKCTPCAKTLERIQPVQFKEHVFIYVDDSNMWIEGKKLAAKQLNLKCVEDPRLRLDIGKVADVVANGREVGWGILYGSEPPPIDTVWNKIREHGWKVFTSKRSRFTNKEKRVDHQMVADITALVSDRSVAKGKIAIVSGDADIIPAIEEGLSKSWSFEIWMWDSGISSALKHLAGENPESLKILPLDTYLKNISFTNFKFTEKQITSSLNARSAVIKKANFTPDEAWQENLSKKLCWPFQFCWIGPERQGNLLDYEDILLIFASGVKPKDDKDFRHHFVKIFQDLREEYPDKVVNYSAYRKEFDKKEEICLTNRYGALKKFDEDLLQAEGGVEGKPSEESELGDDEGFQIVQRKKPHRKSQQYSEQCEHRSKCKSGLNCTHSHTDAEKKFFRHPGKERECSRKKNCNYGSRCWFAHSNKDSFCCECHQWGHLQDKCKSKLS